MIMIRQRVDMDPQWVRLACNKTGVLLVVSTQVLLSIYTLSVAGGLAAAVSIVAFVLTRRK